MAHKTKEFRYFDNPWLSVSLEQDKELKLDPSINLEAIVSENLNLIEANKKNILSMRLINLIVFLFQILEEKKNNKNEMFFFRFDLFMQRILCILRYTSLIENAMIEL
jgi:hypothetical protein